MDESSQIWLRRTHCTLSTWKAVQPQLMCQLTLKSTCQKAVLRVAYSLLSPLSLQITHLNRFLSHHVPRLPRRSVLEKQIWLTKKCKTRWIIPDIQHNSSIQIKDKITVPLSAPLRYQDVGFSLSNLSKRPFPSYIQK